LELIYKYFPDLSELQYSKLASLGKIYNDWNLKINLISRKDIAKLYEHHVLFSLTISKIFSFNSGSSVLDAGTGGGFPGIPLSIVFPDTNFLLVDSIGKKIFVVNDIIQQLELKNVKAQQERIEKLGSKFDFIISRALSSFPEFLKLTQNLIISDPKGKHQKGYFYIKGGDINEEIKFFKNKVQVYELKNYFEEEFFNTKKIIYMPVN